MNRKELSRRGFLKGLGLTVLAGALGIRLKEAPVPTGDILEVTDEPLRPDECTLEANTLVGFYNVSGPWVNVPGPYRRTTYYVNPCMGCDGNDGTTPRGAFRTLQRADAACVPGDTVYVGCADGIIQKC